MTRTPYAYPLPPKAKAELDLILGHDSGEPIYNAMSYAQVFAVAFPVALLLMFAPELWNRIRGRKS